MINSIKNLSAFLFLIACLILSGPASAARTCLTTNMTMYVNGDSVNNATCGIDGTQTCSAGNDSHDCLTPSTACLTANHAVYQMYSNYDQCGFTTIINLAHGSSQNYQISCGYGALPGNVTFSVYGDYNNPTSVTLIAPANQYGIIAGDFCVPSLSDFQITDSGSASGAITSTQFGVIDLRSMTIGGTWNAGSSIFNAWNGGRLNFLGADNNSPSYTNTITSTSVGQVFQVQQNGIANIGLTINIPNAMTMQSNQPFAVGLGGQFAGVNTGTFTGYGATHSTGKRYYMDCTYLSNNVSPSIFPGSINGTNSCGF